MKINRLILFGFLFSSGLIYAQTDFRPGYIITNSSDTLHGEIDSRGDLLMSRICKFKNVESVIYNYSPNDISAYRFIDSKYYVSREINSRKEFLEYLIKGEINVYYMRDAKGDHYYLEKEDEELTEIPYREGIELVDDKLVYYETKKHIGILNYYMQDAPEFQPRIQQVKPEHHDLIKLAEDYHNTVCEDEPCLIYEKRFPFMKISIEPFIGLSKYKGYNKFINEFGGYLFLWAPRMNEKIFYKTGLVYQQVSEEGLDIFKIPIQLQYIYRGYKIQPKISGGFNFLSIKFDENKYYASTLSLNAGLNYKISKTVSLSTSFNSDFRPISKVILSKDLKFDIISYSIIFGLLIDL